MLVACSPIPFKHLSNSFCLHLADSPSC
uniref:Uncharacterized protein n=1 Tax=Arundo donax TaxID=35708 RepID=A0A0A9FJE9_ARUDO